MRILKRSGILCLIVIAAHIAPLDVCAQQRQVSPGAKVRLTVPSKGRSPLVGTLTHIGDTGITLNVQGQTDPIELPFTSVSKFEISIREANPIGGFWKGAGMGFLFGATAGVVIGLVGGDDEGALNLSAEENALVFGVILGIVGAAFGGASGAAKGSEHWEEVAEPFTDWRVGIWAPQHDGLSLTLSRRF